MFLEFHPISTHIIAIHKQYRDGIVNTHLVRTAEDIHIMLYLKIIKRKKDERMIVELLVERGGGVTIEVGVHNILILLHLLLAVTGWRSWSCRISTLEALSNGIRVEMSMHMRVGLGKLSEVKLPSIAWGSGGFAWRWMWFLEEWIRNPESRAASCFCLQLSQCFVCDRMMMMMKKKMKKQQHCDCSLHLLQRNYAMKE